MYGIKTAAVAAWYNVNIPTDWSTEIGFVSLKYTDNHQMQVVMSHMMNQIP